MHLHMQIQQSPVFLLPKTGLLILTARTAAREKTYKGLRVTEPRKLFCALDVLKGGSLSED